MPEEKKSITITITDLDDEVKVSVALTKFFSTIFVYYLENKKDDKFLNLAISCGAYFGKILGDAGFTLQDFKDEESNE